MEQRLFPKELSWLSFNERFFPKELSWLSFNERVLQEAADENNPIIERFRFLGIYSSNMDEFYRVRVADVRRKIIIKMNNNEQEEAAKKQLLMTQMQQKILILTDKFDIIYKKLVSQLAQNNIQLINHHQVNEGQIHWLKSFFQNKVLRHITPILIDKKVNLVSRLHDSATYYYLAIHRDDKPTKYATIEIPTDKMSRFIILPTLSKERKYKKIILLEDIIQLFIEDIFLGFVKFNAIEAYSFKMTRDSEYSINDDMAESYVEKMSDSMKQRLIAEPVRVIYDGDMPEGMVKSLKRHLKHSSFDNLVAAGKVRNVKDFIKFPNIGRSNLENKPVEALTNQQFSAYNTVFEAIQQQDILLYYPYHRFLHFTEFVRQAAFDPHVKHIRITLYRIAKDSRIVSSLIDAVDNGKMVTVVMELRARFDEEANIAWAKTMTDAGIRVVFGNPSFKIHTKICVVSRDERAKMVNYAHIGTGNFNESTAKIYTDFSLFTQDLNITKEVLSIFDLIQLPYRQQNFEHLLVSPLNSKSSILMMIDNEIANAQAGKPANIIFKVNNLVDYIIIDKLYQASQAGVTIRGIVRGMCSLRPKIKGLSDNISIISVVDRFLEHSRVMCFHNNGDKKVYISSADLMKRNMEDRIEVSCPIYDQKLIETITNLLEIHFKDTLKARIIDKDQVNSYVKRGNRKNLRSQNETYLYLKHLEKANHEQNKNCL
ncbi:RNA degradosome polyphosphate kinase [Colwellia sp. 39_35_sub15_T18]|nr:RNA degradosome polyphosphate kinase [Colwellia sp. 39_35_sub15_T18]